MTLKMVTALCAVAAMIAAARTHITQMVHARRTTYNIASTKNNSAPARIIYYRWCDVRSIDSMAPVLHPWKGLEMEEVLAVCAVIGLAFLLVISIFDYQKSVDPRMAYKQAVEQYCKENGLPLDHYDTHNWESR